MFHSQKDFASETFGINFKVFAYIKQTLICINHSELRRLKKYKNEKQTQDWTRSSEANELSTQLKKQTDKLKNRQTAHIFEHKQLLDNNYKKPNHNKPL